MYGFGHNVGGAVAHNLQTFGSIRADGGEGAVPGERAGQIQQVAIDFSGHNPVVGAYSQAFQGLGHAEAFLNFPGGAVGKVYFDHGIINKKGILVVTMERPDAT